MTAIDLLAYSSNLTNKYNPQELMFYLFQKIRVQILPINTILKNDLPEHEKDELVQILPINTILKNTVERTTHVSEVQILPINTILKNKTEITRDMLMFKSYQ